MEVVTGAVPHQWASNTGLSPSQGAGQQGLDQWGRRPGRACLICNGHKKVNPIGLSLGAHDEWGRQTGCWNWAVRLGRDPGDRSGAFAKDLSTTVSHPAHSASFCLCILPILPGPGEVLPPLRASRSQHSKNVSLWNLDISEAGSVWVWGRSWLEPAVAKPQWYTASFLQL